MGNKMSLDDYSGFLTDGLIIEAIKSKKIKIEPLPDLSDVKANDPKTWPDELEEHLRPAAFVFTIGPRFFLISPTVNELDANENVEPYLLEGKLKNKGITLQPGQCIHGKTTEKIGVDKYIMGFIDGLKQNAEKFITIHTTSSTWNPGDGYENPYPILLEMKNDGDKAVHFEQSYPICKMSFFKFDRPVVRSYKDIGFAKKYRK
jgi:deoxycytidine triphosphate deaminase